MKRNLILLMALAGAPGDAYAQGAVDPARQFIGAWKLVSTIQRKADGTYGPNPAYGPKGIGYIIYTDAGVMCATLTDPTIAKWKTLEQPDHAELKNATDHFQAYCGKYTVDAKGGYVVHHVEIDKIPNNMGIARKRFFQFSGNRMMLTADPPPAGITEYTLTWERVGK